MLDKLKIVHRIWYSRRKENLRMPQFLYEPCVGTVGTIFFGIVSVVLSIILYLRAKQKPILCYGINPLRVRIVDKSKTAFGLEVKHLGTSLTGQDITAATIYFWNAGRLTIRQTDVLTTYTITLDDDITLLDTHFIKDTRPECRFYYDDPTGDNHVSVTFDV